MKKKKGKNIKQSMSVLLEEVVNKLIDKIEQEVGQINDKNFPKNMTALKKVIDTLDKLILLNEKLTILRNNENNDEDDLDDKDKAMLENYLNLRLKPTVSGDLT